MLTYTTYRGSEVWRAEWDRVAVQVTCWDRSVGGITFVTSFVRAWENERRVDTFEGMLMKYIQLAKAAAKAEKVEDKWADDFLTVDRPALKEFMGSSVDGDGHPREPSVLMVVRESGQYRVGLKDEQLGGWLWRVGDDLDFALDAIESALADGSARFSSGGNGRSKRR